MSLTRVTQFSIVVAVLVAGLVGLPRIGRGVLAQSAGISSSIVIVTPAFTPGPGCSATPTTGVVTATITIHATTTSALFTNTSTTCSYPVGLTIYRMFSALPSDQDLFDYTLAVIP